MKQRKANCLVNLFFFILGAGIISFIFINFGDTGVFKSWHEKASKQQTKPVKTSSSKHQIKQGFHSKEYQNGVEIIKGQPNTAAIGAKKSNDASNPLSDGVAGIKKSIEDLTNMGNDLKNKAKNPLAETSGSIDDINISLDTKNIQKEIYQNVEKAKKDSSGYMKKNYPEQVRFFEEVGAKSQKIYNNELKYIKELFENLSSSSAGKE